MSNKDILHDINYLCKLKDDIDWDMHENKISGISKDKLEKFLIDMINDLYNKICDKK